LFFFLVIGRCIVIFFIVPRVEPKTFPIITSLYLAYGLAESIRYPYYVFNTLMEEPPYILTWLRYSAFLVLYPIGLLSECGSSYFIGLIFFFLSLDVLRVEYLSSVASVEE